MFARVDKVFLWLVAVIVILGTLFFISASFGVLAKNPEKFQGILFNQLVLGLGLGIIAFFVAIKISYKFWRKYALHIFIGSIILLLLVFVPGLGFRHAGALRWVSIGPISFQPAEFLKFASIIYFSAWLSWAKDKVGDFKFGLLPLFLSLGVIAFILFKQPDVKSFLLILATSLTMFFLSGAKWKSLMFIMITAIIGLAVLVSFKPYLLGRIETFFEPERDLKGASYQLDQSLIAFGSGGLFGRGLGQSIQKFSYLPEPQGDSIFAVVGEEIGFVGSVALILFFIAFAFRGLKIANDAPDLFSRLVVIGIVILTTVQAFLNMASATGVVPLTGVPLPFVSHGGTSLMIMLASMGIVLNISSRTK